MAPADPTHVPGHLRVVPPPLMELHELPVRQPFPTARGASLTGDHWHNCRLVLDTGTLLVAAEDYVADRRHPVGHSMALLGVRTTGDPDRALSLRRLVAGSRSESPADVVVVDGRVTITAGGDVLTLRGDRYPPTGRHTPFSGSLDWVGASPEASTDGLHLVRIILRQPHRRSPTTPSNRGSVADCRKNPRS